MTTAADNFPTLSLSSSVTPPSTEVEESMSFSSRARSCSSALGGGLECCEGAVVLGSIIVIVVVAESSSINSRSDVVSNVSDRVVDGGDSEALSSAEAHDPVKQQAKIVKITTMIRNKMFLEADVLNGFFLIVVNFNFISSLVLSKVDLLG